MKSNKKKRNTLMNKKKKYCSALSIAEALVGISIMLIFFVGIMGVLRTSIRISSVSRARVGAIALAGEQMEKIRNLPYEEVGTQGGIPSGDIPQTETFLINNTNYTRRTLVQYVDDVADGEGVVDENGINNDYKRVKVEVSWGSRTVVEPVVFISNVVPRGIENNVGGGTLRITVLDAAIAPVAAANVHIENNGVAPSVSVDVATDSQGRVIFPGAPANGSYEITVSKPGYSTAQTYDDVAPNLNPEPGHMTILVGEVAEKTFFIDYLSIKTIYTYEAEGQADFDDLFNNENEVATTSDVVVAGGQVDLENEGGEYDLVGFLDSTTRMPVYLKSWQDFSWNDSEPAQTDIKYHFLFASGTDWELIPDSDLGGNSVGFDVSPVDISSLATTSYSEIRLRANLSSLSTSTTPSLFDWSLSWVSNVQPVANVPFHMRGNKIIGRDLVNDPIYKYSENLVSDASGRVREEDLEWDAYLISLDGVDSGYDISESCPFQPAAINPDTNDNVTILLLEPHTAHTYLVHVVDGSGFSVANADVRLYRTGYDQTVSTSPTCGQSFFSSLTEVADYTLEVTRTGYQNFSESNIDISGQKSKVVSLVST